MIGAVVASVAAVALAFGLYLAIDGQNALESELKSAQAGLKNAQEAKRACEQTLNEVLPWVSDLRQGADTSARQVMTQVRAILIDHAKEEIPKEKLSEDAIKEHLKRQGPTSILQVISDYKEQVQKLVNDVKERTEQLAHAQDEASQKVRELNKSIEERDRSLEDANRESRTKLDQIEEELKRKDEELKQAKLEFERTIYLNDLKMRRLESDLRKATEEIDTKDSQIAELKKGGEGASDQHKVEEDGHVLEVGRDSDIVVIDIGGHERVRAGRTFDVFYKERGGLPVWKGKVEVTDVQHRVSKCRILRQTDYVRVGDRVERREYNANDPITPGCIVHNPSFVPGRQSKFALVGEFRFHTTQELTRLIELDGDSKVVEVRQADIVVLGQPPNQNDVDKTRLYEQQLEQIRATRPDLMREEEIMRYLRDYKGDADNSLIAPEKKKTSPW